MTTNETNFSSMEYIFLLPDEVLTANTTKLVHLKNPRTEEKALFLLDFDNRKLYEILTFNEKYRSWFVGENIISDGSLKIATICNPLFLILPYLLKASKMKQNIPLDQLLEDKDFPDMVLLIEIVNDISFIADRKGPSEFNVWCYNEASTLSWLQDKTENLSTTLQKKRERTLQGFSLALNNSIDDKDSYLNLAYGLLCEYLCENMSTLLRIHLKLPEIEQKEKENLQQDLPFKKMKLNEVTMEKNCTKTQLSLKSKSALSAKEKGLARSAKGTKSIASFFIKKL